MHSLTALSGHRVIELSGDPGVAYCAKILGEFGAEVIKVEPAGGDPLRRFGPRGDAGESALFIYTNTGKSSVTVEDADQLLRLIDGADIVIGSDSADDLAARGLSQTELIDRRGLIYVSIRPYGLAGPDAGRFGTELDVFHSGGEGALLPGGLSYEMYPDRPPVKAGRHLTDYDAGNVGALLALALTIRRLDTGTGAFIDVSKQDVAVSLGRATLDRQFNQGIRVNRADRGYDYGGIFPCKEGFITVRPTQDAFWVGLANGIGRPDLVDDPRFASRLGRETNAKALDEVINEYCSTRRAQDIYEQLAPHGTPIGYYADAEALVTSKHAWKRGDLATIDGIDHKIVVPRPGYTFDGQPLPAPRPWPTTSGSPPPKAPDRPDAAPVTSSPSIAPLAGLRVLDLTWVAAGPYTTELLSMLGADVAKVESSLQPDLFRQMADDPTAGLDRSSRFNSVNLNKQSIGINFKTPEGRALVRQLAERADLIVSNYRPGALERLGVTYNDLKDVNPNVVVACISSAGRGGTDPGYAGYASIFNSIGGLGHLTGYGDGPAVEVRDSVDLRVGTVATVGALAALLAVRRGGHGTAVDVSAQQAITGLVGDSVVEYQLTGTVPSRQGNGLYDLWPYGVYPCSGEDCWVALAARDDSERAALGELVEVKIDGERGAADAAIARWTAARTAEEVVAQLDARGIPGNKVFGGQDLLDDPHVRERGLLREIDHPMLGKQIAVGAPWRIDDRAADVRAAPALGGDTIDVLKNWLGFDETAVTELLDAGAIELQAAA